MNAFAECMPSILFLALLSAAVAIGYYLAWTDFKPKQINANDDGGTLRNPVSKSSPAQRKLTDSQLGLYDLNAQTALSPFERQRMMREDRVRQYTRNTPDEAASVIKGWLSDS
jgi:hypothetical protein